MKRKQVSVSLLRVNGGGAEGSESVRQRRHGHRVPRPTTQLIPRRTESRRQIKFYGSFPNLEMK